MKIKNILYTCLVASLSFTACSDWTEVEREVYDNQTGFEKLVPLIDAQSEEDLTPSQRKFYAELREYRKTPHVKGFGWFGNWTGKGTNAQNYLKMLPDSVDFVSLWGARGNLSPEQKADLKFFQDVKGGKALLCWIVQEIGSGITPPGQDMHKYWVEGKGQGSAVKGAEAYADAIADTIVKYNLDGFDIDYEPGYGHSGSLASYKEIGPGENQFQPMYYFIKRLYDRFQAHEKETGRDMMLVMDGQPEKLSTETSKMIDHYIYQAYWETSTNSVISKIDNTHLTDWERKTIVTVEFEQCWRTGGIHPQSQSANWSGRRSYYSVRPEFQGIQGGQIFDYATMDLPSGKRIGGIGTYHMEYDFKNEPAYKWLRAALYLGNQVYPGNFQ